MNPHDPQHPDPENAAWEEAMSRDFDARVRDLHESPLDFDSVKGKAHKIRRNRRAAVAGGILGVAAIVTPIAVLANNNGDADTKEPPFVTDPTTTIADPAPPAADYIVDGVWHQADGATVNLPANDFPYDAAVVWNDQLVATRYDGEAFSVSDVIDTEGTVVDRFDSTGSVVVNPEGTTIAWIDTDGTVMTAWDGDEVSMGSVDLSSAGEGVAWSAVAVSGGPSCYEVEDGCAVYVVGGDGTVESLNSHGVNDSPLEEYVDVKDVDGTRATVVTEVRDGETCNALVNTDDGAEVWQTCDHQLWQISPDGESIAAPPSYFDGLGPTSISVLNAETQGETGSYSPEGGFIATWAWSTDGQLLFDTYDGARWHLIAMAPDDGAITEIGEPVKGDELDSPFTLIRH